MEIEKIYAVGNRQFKTHKEAYDYLVNQRKTDLRHAILRHNQLVDERRRDLADAHVMMGELDARFADRWRVTDWGLIDNAGRALSAKMVQPRMNTKRDVSRAKRLARLLLEYRISDLNHSLKQFKVKGKQLQREMTKVARDDIQRR